MQKIYPDNIHGMRIAAALESRIRMAEHYNGNRIQDMKEVEEILEFLQKFKKNQKLDGSNVLTQKPLERWRNRVNSVKKK
tara:strand:- start:590 stop:829 length:240 start_codon:yes stop_codon:yes gene_type:complete